VLAQLGRAALTTVAAAVIIAHVCTLPWNSKCVWRYRLACLSPSCTADVMHDEMLVLASVCVVVSVPLEMCVVCL